MNVSARRIPPRVVVVLLLSLPAAAVTPVGEAAQVSPPSSFWQVAPAVAPTPDGGFLVVWEDLGAGLVARFVDSAGAAVGGEVGLVSNSPFPETPGRVDFVAHRSPGLVALPDGGYLLTWEEESSVLSYSYFRADFQVEGREVLGLTLSAAGVPVGEPFRINAVAAGHQSNPAAAVLNDGRVVVAWQEAPAGARDAVQVEARLIADGAPAGNDLRISGAPAARVARPLPAALDDGGFLVVWTGLDGHGAGILGRSFTAGGQPTGPAIVLNAVQLENQSSPSLTPAGGGGFLVAWQHAVEPYEEYRIHGRFLDASGAPAGGDLPLSAEVGEADGAPAVASLPDGGFLVVWLGWSHDFPQWIIGQRLDASGARVGEPMQVSAERPLAQHRLDAVVSGGRVLVAWEGRDVTRHVVTARSYDLTSGLTVLSVQAAGSN